MQTFIFFTKKYALSTSKFLFLKRIEEKTVFLLPSKDITENNGVCSHRGALLYLLLTDVSYMQCGVLYVMY